MDRMFLPHPLVFKWRVMLGLKDWTVSVDFSGELPLEAQVIVNDSERFALLRVDEDCPPDLIEYTVVHELLHLVLRDLEYGLKTGKTAEEMERLDAVFERSINQITAALVGRVWYPWHRDDAFIKDDRA